MRLASPRLYPALRHQREAPAAGAEGPQQVRLRGHRQRVRRAAAYQDHPDVLAAGSEHHQREACPRVRVLRPAQAAGPDVREAVCRRQPEACRSAKAPRPERSSVHRPAAERSGPAAAWLPEPVSPSERAQHSVPASAQAAFVPAAVKPGAEAAGSVLRVWSEAAVAELPAWAPDQRVPAAPMKAAEVASVHAAAEPRQEAEAAPSVQPRAEAAEGPDASRPAGAAAWDVTVPGAAEAARPGAELVQPRAAARSVAGEAAAELRRAAAAVRAAWPRAAAVPQVPSAVASVFRQGRLRLPARPARSRSALLCLVHAMPSLRMASR